MGEDGSGAKALPPLHSAHAVDPSPPPRPLARYGRRAIKHLKRPCREFAGAREEG